MDLQIVIADSGLDQFFRYFLNGTFDINATVAPVTNPRGVELDPVFAYVLDTTPDLIIKFLLNETAEFIESFPAPPPANSARGITTNETHMFVVDQADAEVYILQLLPTATFCGTPSFLNLLIFLEIKS